MIITQRRKRALNLTEFGLQAGYEEKSRIQTGLCKAVRRMVPWKSRPIYWSNILIQIFSVNNRKKIAGFLPADSIFTARAVRWNRHKKNRKKSQRKNSSASSTERLAVAIKASPTESPMVAPAADWISGLNSTLVRLRPLEWTKFSRLLVRC